MRLFYFFTFYSWNYCKLPLCVTFSNSLTIFKSLEEHMPSGVFSINYETIGYIILVIF